MLFLGEWITLSYSLHNQFQMQRFMLLNRATFKDQYEKKNLFKGFENLFKVFAVCYLKGHKIGKFLTMLIEIASKCGMVPSQIQRDRSCQPACRRRFCKRNTPYQSYAIILSTFASKRMRVFQKLEEKENLIKGFAV